MQIFDAIPPGQATLPAKPGTSNGRKALVCTTRMLGALVSVLVMLVLKHHYSQATADQLDWILAPTARLVAWLTPAHPLYESGVGYVDFAHGIIVAPACAGVNFMIMAFALAAFCGLTALKRPVAIPALLISALGGAYGYTLLVNALRIAFSMALYQADIYGGWVTVARVHRLAGIALYLGALGTLFAVLRRAKAHYDKHYSRQRAEKSRRLPGWLPLAWYLTGTVAVPLVNLRFRPGAPLVGEHCLTVLIAGPCLWGVAIVTARLWKAVPRTPRRVAGGGWGGRPTGLAPISGKEVMVDISLR